MGDGDYYQILDLDRGASQKMIREAYRKLAFQYHPDRNKDDPAALEKMKHINEAYAVLSDPRKKKQYDTLSQEYGAHGYQRFRQAYSDEDIFRGSDIHQIFEEMAHAFGFRGFDEVFGESYGQRFQTFEFRRPGIFGRVIFFGPRHVWKRKESDQPEPSIFSQNRTGILGTHFSFLLKKVAGVAFPERGRDWHEKITLPPHLALEGGKLRFFHRKKAKELMITVPPGVKQGQRIRLKGMGANGKQGGLAGDLYLEVSIRRPLLEKIISFLKR